MIVPKVFSGNHIPHLEIENGKEDEIAQKIEHVEGTNMKKYIELTILKRYDEGWGWG